MPVTETFIQLQSDVAYTGKKLDSTSVVTSAGTVYRENAFIADPADPNGRASVLHVPPGPNEYGLTIRSAPGSIDEQIMLLRRLVKVLESNTIVDSAQRQRVTLDAITASLTLATVTTVGTVSAVTGITNALPTGTNVLGQVRMEQDSARNTFANAIRSKLVFS